MSSEAVIKMRLFESLKKEMPIGELSGYGRSTIWKTGNKRMWVKYAEGKGDRYFFGIDTDFSKKFSQSTDYILFICRNLESLLLVPATVLADIFRGVAPAPHDNQIKINIFYSYGRFEVQPSGKSRSDLTGYCKDIPRLISFLTGRTTESVVRIKKELDMGDKIDYVRSHEPEFFKETTQEQIYDLKYHQLKIAEILKLIY